MHRYHRAATIPLAVALLLSPALAFAAKHRIGDKIVSIDAAANKIVVTEGKADVTYTVNMFTVVMLNGSPAKLADLKKGMKVDVSVSGVNVATKIEAQTSKASSKKKPD